MKLYIKKSQHGFAHPLLLAFLLTAVIGVVGFSGYRVLDKNKSVAVSSSAAPKGQIVISKQNISSQPSQPDTPSANPEKIIIKSPGSAGASDTPKPSTNTVSQQPQTQTGVVNVSSQYDISTPLGSLSQLIYEAQQGDYGNALYFVTPEFIARAYATVQAQNFNQFINNCQSNEACKMLANTDVSFNVSHITGTYCTPPAGSGFTECEKVGTKFTIENNSLQTVYYKSVGYNVHDASVTMLRSSDSTNWVINKITVDSFSL
jgi:hypothetical protein